MSSGLSVWVFTLRSGIPLTTGGGLGSGGNSRGVDEVDVLGFVGDVSGSSGADLAKRKE